MLQARLENAVRVMTDEGRPPWTRRLTHQERLQDYLNQERQQQIKGQIMQLGGPQNGPAAVNDYTQQMEGALARQAMAAAPGEEAPPEMNSEES